MTGIIPAITIAKAGTAASAKRSSLANSKVRTANVLKLNGLRINVAGSSFSTSTKTNNKAVNKLPRIIGICILLMMLTCDIPAVFATSSISSFIFSNAASTVFIDTARKRTR